MVQNVKNEETIHLTPYKNDIPEGFFVVVDADGNYSKYSLTDHQPILETPSPDEILTEYKNGVAWPYYNIVPAGRSRWAGWACPRR